MADAVIEARDLIRRFCVQLFPDRVLGSDSMPGFRAVDDDLLTISRDIGEMNIGKLIIGFTLVHLLFDTTTTFNGIRHIFLELLVSWGALWVQNLQEGAHRLLDTFFISTFHRFAQTKALIDFFIAIGVAELVMKGFCQV